MTPATQPRTVTTREDVARAALELADAEGLEALSMRRLAGALGVGTMTLYGYFRNKGELLDGIVDAAVEDAEDLRTAGPWRDCLRDVALAARRNMLCHPALVELRFRRPVLRPEALRFAETIMTILTGAGMPRDEAARAFRLLFTFLFGYAALSPAGAEDAAARSARSALAALPPDRYPALTAAVEEAAVAMGGEETFAFGLDLILDGIAARLEAA
jgi:AcrR family transcriptional regulator